MPDFTRAWGDWYRRVLPAYWIFLFCATHFPKLKLDLGYRQSDKTAHFIAFGILAFLYWRFAESWQRPLSERFALRAFLILGLYAGADEYLQRFVGRSPAWMDFLANLVGITVVLAGLEWRRRVLARRANEDKQVTAQESDTDAQ